MEDINRPHIVRVTDFHIDSDYVEWFSEIKRRYRSAQIKAAIKVNTEKLAFNWSLGRDLVMRKAEEKWGSGVVEQLSFDLQEAFPNDKGFSSRNVWRMKQWYLFFSSNEARKKLPQVAAELQQYVYQRATKLPQLGTEFDSDFPSLLGLVPWGQQTEILSKCKSIDEALFYIKMCILDGWSRATLMNSIKGNLYQNYGKALSNYDKFLPEAQSRLAQEITKENYDNTPLGVAFYDNINIAPSKLLPSAEELQARVRLLEQELHKSHGKTLYKSNNGYAECDV